MLGPGQLSGQTLPKPLTWRMVCHLWCSLLRCVLSAERSGVWLRTGEETWRQLDSSG